MICSLTNKSDLPLMVDFVCGQRVMLRPQQKLIYEDSITYPTPTTWVLVEHGLLEDEDELDFPSLGVSTKHNWMLEGF